MEDRFKNIPDELKRLPNWVVWGMKNKKNRIAKVPYNPITGYGANVTKAESWVDYQTAIDNSSRYSGIGFVLTDTPYVGIDIDDCITEKGVDAKAQEIIRECNSYTEISTSGTGVHIILKGSKPQGRCKKKFANIEVEMYDTGRYLVMTGNIYDGEIKPIQANTEAIEMVARLLGTNETANKPQVKKTTVETDSMSIEEVITALSNSVQGQGLFEGTITNADASAGDIALVIEIAKITSNPVTIDGVFRRSKRYRSKWDEKHGKQTYGEMTINKALEIVQERQNSLLCFPKTYGKQNKPLLGCWENVDAVLRFKNINLRENILNHKIETDINGKWKTVEEIDFLVTELGSICNELGLLISDKSLRSHMEFIAHKNCYNPWSDFLDDCSKLPANEVAFDHLLRCIVVNEEYGIPKEIIRRYMLTWLVTAVKLARNEGEFAPQGVLVFVGTQGIGKTSFVRWLMPRRELVLTGSSIDANNKDSVMKNTTVAIVELGEFSRTMRNDIEALKAFITNNSDVYRKPYGRSVRCYPRRTSFIATINDDDFLTDMSGNRRFWVIPVKEINLEQLNTMPAEALWSAAVALEKSGDVKPYFTQEEIALINRVNTKFAHYTPVEQVVRDGILLDGENGGHEYEGTASWFCSHFGLPKNNAVQVGRVLTKLAHEGLINAPTKGRANVTYYKLKLKIPMGMKV